MTTIATPLPREQAYPARVRVDAALGPRSRLTVAFRPILALPHLVLVGGPIAFLLSWTWPSANGARYDVGGGGVLGAVAVVSAVIAWFALVFNGREPEGLWSLAAFYLRWRVRAVAYVALLRDEYPPFGDGAYPAELTLEPPAPTRDRLAVAFRIVLVLPHLLALCALGAAWVCTTVVAWFAILITGRYPESLYHFAVQVFGWSTRVEAYLLLLTDDYPSFRFV